MSVFLGDEQQRPVDTDSLRRAAAMVLEMEGFSPSTELAVILVEPEQIAEYNARFMGREGATDVLAFPLEDLQPGAAPGPVAGEPPVALGDVFLCPDEIASRAERERVPVDDLMHLLLVHGILHLMGYQHDADGDADVMERREDDLMAAMGRSMS